MNDPARSARATNQAELVQAPLIEAGIPSMLRRSREYDVPDMLAAGPRNVMVPSRAHDAAREVLLQAEIVNDNRAVVARPARGRLPGPRTPEAP